MNEEDYIPGTGDKIRIGLFYFASISGVAAWVIIALDFIGITSICF